MTSALLTSVIKLALLAVQPTLIS